MDNIEPQTRLKGKYVAIVVCWLLGNGCLFPWNSMLTIEDYYIYLFPLNLETSSKGGFGAFIGICTISGAFGVADAHVQGGMVGDLSYMQPEFIQSFVAGLAASGALTSGLRLITKATFKNSKDGLKKGAISEGCKTILPDLAAGGIQTIPKEDGDYAKTQERKENKKLLFENIDYLLDMFLIYALTLSIFPGFISEDTGAHSLGSWYALVLIEMYNVGDLIGRYIPLLEFLKLESRKLITVATLSHFLLVPTFYFTAKYGDQGWMIAFTSFLGISNGYLTVCVMTSAPKGYKGPEQNALGNLFVLFLSSGIFAGVIFDWLWLIGKGW
ncbi:hypothetical protein KIW84_057446 [Lathyrus oleraceus]|uniref:Uncharacterized protein n=1 Tax=Pisum sativum TaxID=3888 RepID=A0A9D5AMX3_PEA|nr:hypothetical protein KIW84_057446 [Pisum sativum]